MPIKPDAITKGAAKAMEQNPNFGKDALRTIINETPVLKDALIGAGLIKEVNEDA